MVEAAAERFCTRSLKDRRSTFFLHAYDVEQNVLVLNSDDFCIFLFVYHLKDVAFAFAYKSVVA